MIDAKTMRKIVLFCKKNGIIKFKSGDFEIEITPTHSNSRKTNKENASEQGLASGAFPSWESLTREQRLLWSATPDIPEQQ